MDYHSDRFSDFSLMVYEDDELVGLLPANVSEDMLYSHQGLTYGGLFLKDNIKLDKVFSAVDRFVKEAGINKVAIKQLPDFYQHNNFKTLINHLQKGSEVFHTNKVLAIDYSLPFSIHKTKLKHYRKNSSKGFEIKEECNLDSFWNEVLIPRLNSKHNTTPVHTLDEISLLKSRFPEQIKQYNIYLNSQILAGITIFDKGPIVKSQYGATNTFGEPERALEYLFIELIQKFKKENKRYFSMGTVMDKTFPEGYNPGLMRQKIELGCREYQQDFYRYSVV